MKTILLRNGLFAGALVALALTSHAQVVEFRATLNAGQEVPATSSPATGNAIMLYDVAANTFDLIVSISGMTNAATASHLHEGLAGVNGSVVTNLGSEAVYTRTGNTLRATFRGLTHGGDKLKLLQSGVYYNIHSAQFPGGEIRGQLIARPKRLYAHMTVAQEQAAFPAVNFAGLNDFGGAVMLYDVAANRVSLRLSVFNLNNTFSNSHFHEGAPGVSGPVATGLGTNANAGGYTTANGHLAGTFDIAYTGDPIKLLTGGTYLNFHTTTFAGGEVRGQVYPSDEVAGTRFANVSVRGFVGTGEQVLIQGLTVNGPEPIRVLVTAKGPSLAAFGVTGVLANPRLAIYDSGQRQIATNDDVGTPATGNDLFGLPGVPVNTLESALLLVLPPGNYTVLVSGTGTGIALLEATDLRNFGGVPTASSDGTIRVVSDGAPASRSSVAAATRAGLELCAAVPLSVAVAAR